MNWLRENSLKKIFRGRALYTEEDKIIVRNMTLNGRVIGGLVTEDHRPSWINMSIEEMYDQICVEIEAVQEKLRRGLSLSDVARTMDPEDQIGHRILNTYIYSEITGDSMIPGSLETFVKNGCAIDGKRLRDEHRKIVELIFNKLNGKDLTDDELKKLLLKVATASPVEKVDLFDDDTVILYSPEEKYVAVEVLKKFRSEYAEWYEKVLSSLDDLSDEELQELLDMLK